MIKPSKKVTCSIVYVLGGLREQYTATGGSRRVAAQRAIAQVIAKHPYCRSFPRLEVDFV